jgi:AcrR family transcriptional regulator
MSSTRAADTRVAILDAARTLFEANGYHAVGLEAVAAHAGVSRQAIYLHFDSKSSLLQALHERINERDVAPAMDNVWTAPDASRGLDAFVRASATAAANMIGIFMALDAARRVDSDVEASWTPGKERRYADCTRMADWLERDGLLGTNISRRHAADVIFGLAGVVSFQTLVEDRGWSSSRWVRWITETLRRTLLR